MIILQHGVGECAELLRISRKRHQEFCDQFKIQYIQDFERRCPERLPHWEKLLLVQQYLPQTDILLWLDADALVLQDVDLSRVLTCDIAMSKAQMRNKYGAPLGLEFWNSGVIFFRNCPTIETLLKNAWSRWPNDVPLHQHPKNDELALNLACAELGITVQPLEAKYNSWKNNAVDNPVIKAWHGEPEDAVRMRFAEALSVRVN